MLNDLLKRSGVEKLLPCTEYILQRSDRRRVHLVGDLPKPLLNSPTDLLAAFNPRLPGKLRQAGGNGTKKRPTVVVQVPALGH
jgi:hypothetical protein